MNEKLIFLNKWDMTWTIMWAPECINFLKNEILTLEKAKHYYSFLQYLAKFQASYKFKKSKNEIFYLSFKGLVILKKLLTEY